MNEKEDEGKKREEGGSQYIQENLLNLVYKKAD